MRVLRPTVLILVAAIHLVHVEPPPSLAGVGAGRDLPSGRWSRYQPRTGGISNAEQQELLDRLNSIGYVSGSQPAPLEKNVVLNTAEQTFHGLNLYTSGHAPEALLLDMDGKVLHRWRHEFDRTWPDHPTRGGLPAKRFWRRAFLYPDGGLLAIHEGLGILKLDKDSNLIWARANQAHHDLAVMPDGRIYVLTREAHVVSRVSRSAPILEDFVSILDPDGNELSRISLLECFENSADEHSWIDAAREFWHKERSRNLATNPGDIFHTNSIEVLDGRFAALNPAFREGNLLVSFCHLDMIAVVDLRAKKVVWSLAENLSLQHDPRLTPDGRLIVFDNNWKPGRSRVITLHPGSGKVDWSYGMSDEEDFFSRTCGAAQWLPNGNVLITESDNGRAFEITRKGRIVWEFLNPHRAGRGGEYIATLFEMVRLPSGFPIDWAHHDEEGEPELTLRM